jgi:hypothetical protein
MISGDENEGDMEEYEFDIVWSKDKGIWVTTLRDGHYLVNAKCKGYIELNEIIEINRQNPTPLCSF